MSPLLRCTRSVSSLRVLTGFVSVERFEEQTVKRHDRETSAL